MPETGPETLDQGTASDDPYAGIEYPGDPPEEPEDDVEEDEGEAPEESEDGTVEEQAEETSEEEEGAGDEPPPDSEDVPDLSALSPEVRSVAERYAKKVGDRRVGDLTRSWQSKLDKAKTDVEDAQQAKQALDALNKAFEDDAETFIERLLVQAHERGYLKKKDAGPEDPGEMPDPLDRDEFNEWLHKKEARDAWRREQEYAQREKQIEERFAPVQELVEMTKRARQISQDRELLGADEGEMTEIVTLMAEAGKDRGSALKLIQELVRLRKGQVETKKKVETARKGMEEKPGLSRTQARRPRPRSTGDAMRDTFAEMEAEGRIPDDL